MNLFKAFQLIIGVVIFLLPTTAQLFAQDIIGGNIFLDHNSDGVKNGSDYSHPVIKVFAYDDTDDSGTLNSGDLVISNTLSDEVGDYSMIMDTSGATRMISSIVAMGADDAEERVSTGTMNLISSDLELSEEDGNSEQLIGIRFANINIPAGAVISNAYIRFQAKQTLSTACNLNLTGHLSTTSQSFSQNDDDISDRDTTNASVNWMPGSWTESSFYDSDNLTTVVSELIGQSGWSISSAVTFIISGSGEREAWSRDGSGAEPELFIEYSMSYSKNNYLIALANNNFEPESVITLPATTYYTYADGGGTITNADFAFYGETVYCFGFSDDSVESGLSVMNRISGENRLVGMTGVTGIESTAIDTKTGILYAMDEGQLGTVSRTTAVFVPRPQSAGTGSHTTLSDQTFTDLDGLTFDHLNGILWASERNNSDWDVLIQVDPITGAHVPDAFGAGNDFVQIKDAADLLLADIDDIALSPEDGLLYAIANDQAVADYDLLITINKTNGLATVVDTIKDASGEYVNDVEGLGFTNKGILSATTGDGSRIDNSIYNLDPVTAIASYIGTYKDNDDYESCDCMTVSNNQVSGVVYEDADANQDKGVGEAGFPDVTVYIYFDSDKNGTINPVLDQLIDSVDTDVNGEWDYIVGSNVDLLFEIDEDDLPIGNTMSTDNLEVAAFDSGVGGAADPDNNFGYNNGVVPVALSSFTASENNCSAILQWTSELELDFAYYEIQRSTDATNFNVISSVFGKPGIGTKNYIYSDRLAASQNFYRLKMVDVDGTFEYTEVRQLKMNCDKFNAIAIYPNPIEALSGILTVEYYAESEKTNMVVSDMLGRPIQITAFSALPFSNNKAEINIGNIAAGTYLLQIEGNRLGKLFTVLQ